MRFPWLLKSTREASWRGMRPRPRGTEETTGAGEGTPHLTEPRGLLLVSQAPQTAVAETPCTVPGLQLGMGPEEEPPARSKSPPSADGPTWSGFSSSRTAWMASRHSLSMDSNSRSLVSSLSAWTEEKGVRTL